MSSNNLDNWKGVAQQLGELDEEIKRLTKLKKDVEGGFRELIADKGDIVFGDYSFNCKGSAGRKTLDKKKLEESGVDLEPFMKTGRPYNVMTIKKVVVA